VTTTTHKVCFEIFVFVLYFSTQNWIQKEFAFLFLFKTNYIYLWSEYFSSKYLQQ
jgi:hypothetical protein